MKRPGVPPAERLAALGKRLAYPLIRIGHIARGVPPPPPPVSPPSRLAHAWCQGSGIEIGGGAHNPFGLRTLNVDVTGSMATDFKRMERERCGMALPVDLVPHRDRIYDAGRDRTTLTHLVEDYRTRADRQPEDPGGHHHVWVTEDVIALVGWMIGELRLPWEIVSVQDPDDKVGNGFAVVIRKNG